MQGGKEGGPLIVILTAGPAVYEMYVCIYSID